MVIVLIGPMGCGKTTIGEVLSRKLNWDLFDADDFHPVANKEKMSEGIPLDDDDRKPWLEILRGIIEKHLDDRKSMILACSALKKKYRDSLGINQEQVVSVFLKGRRSLLESRIDARSHEYMSKELLQSQLNTLEEPETGITVDISGTPEEISETIISHLIN